LRFLSFVGFQVGLLDSSWCKPYHLLMPFSFLPFPSYLLCSWWRLSKPPTPLKVIHLIVSSPLFFPCVISISYLIPFPPSYPTKACWTHSSINPCQMLRVRLNHFSMWCPLFWLWGPIYISWYGSSQKEVVKLLRAFLQHVWGSPQLPFKPFYSPFSIGLI
jgi:hypothetical protein